MLFTWDTTNLCIVFRWWHITNTANLILSLIGVAALTAGYELIREFSRRYEARVAKSSDDLPRKSPIYSCYAPSISYVLGVAKNS